MLSIFARFSFPLPSVRGLVVHARSLSVSFSRLLSARPFVRPSVRAADSLFSLPLGPRFASVGPRPAVARAVSLSLSLARSPGPEVVMSDSVARLVASCRIVANDDVTLETSRLVIQVVSVGTTPTVNPSGVVRPGWLRREGKGVAI